MAFPVDKGKRMDHHRLGYLIAAALLNARGREEVAAAERCLQDLVARRRFNSARAMKVYAAAVDKAVWASLKDMHSRRHLYRSYKVSGLRELCGRQLSDEFKSKTGTKDDWSWGGRLRELLGQRTREV